MRYTYLYYQRELGTWNKNTAQSLLEPYLRKTSGGSDGAMQLLALLEFFVRYISILHLSLSRALAMHLYVYTVHL